MHDIFRKFANVVSQMIGSAWAFLFTIALILGTGYYFSFSASWKNNLSVVATVTALFLLIFLQKSQNHSDKATHLKLDELIRAAEGARNELASVEEEAEREIDQLRRQADDDQPA